MIVVDTSALVAIILREHEAEQCKQRLLVEKDVLISSPTLTEALIVAARKSIGREMATLFEMLDHTVIPVNEADAIGAADAYRQWGKGFHAASLNFGDCFAYALAKSRGCPLLFIGNDFSKTDVVSALSPAA